MTLNTVIVALRPKLPSLYNTFGHLLPVQWNSFLEIMNILSKSSLHPVLCVKLSFHPNLQKAECLLAQDAVLLALLLHHLLNPDLFLIVSALHASTVLWPTTDGELKSLDLSSIFIIYFFFTYFFAAAQSCALCTVQLLKPKYWSVS